MTLKTLTTTALTAVTTASLLCSLTVRAAIINWGSPAYIAGDTDVATTGNLVAAYSLNQGAATINGVAFANAQTTFTSLTNATYGTNFLLSVFANHYALFGAGTTNPFGTLSQSYRTLLSNGVYGGSISGGVILAVPVVTATNLTFGHQYLLQVWANDSRTARASSDYSDLSSPGGNDVNIYYNNTGASGGVGQYAIGTFIADGNIQPFTIVGNPASGQNGDTYFNAVQIRDLGMASGLGIGFWNGLAGNNVLDNTSLNFCTNASTAPVGTAASLNTLLSLTNACYFYDAYYNSSTLVPVTSTNITMAAGGVSTGSINFLNSAITYTLASSDANGIAGSTALNKSGVGTLILDGANSYSGGTLISSGTVQVGNGDAQGTLGSGPVVNDASLVFDRNDGPTLGYTISGEGTVTQAGPGTVNFDGALSGPLTVVQSGPGTLILSGNNTYTGRTVINSNGNNALSVTSQLNNGAYTGAIAIASNSVFSYNSQNQQVLSGVISGAGALTQNGNGTLILSGASTYTGGTTIAAGSTLYLNSGGATTGGAGPGKITINANGTLYVNMGNSELPNPIIGGSSSVMNVNLSTGNEWITNVLSLAGFQGVINVNFSASGGQLVVGNSSTITVPVNASATWNVYPGTVVDFNGLQTNAATVNLYGIPYAAAADGALRLDESVQSGPVILNGNSEIGNGNATGVSTISGIISDGGEGFGFTKTCTAGAANPIVLTAINTYHGATIISNGTLRIGAGGGIPNSSSIQLAPSTLLDVSPISGFTVGANQTLANLSGSATINGSLTMASGATLALTNTTSITPLVVTNGTMTLNNISANITLSPFDSAVNGGYLLISAGTGGSVVAGGSFASSTVTVTGLPSSGTPSLSIIGGSLYLVFTGGAPAIGSFSPYTATNLFAFAGSPGPTYSVGALGPEISYSWYTNGVLVAGATSSSFTPITTTMPAGLLTNTVVISNANGTNFNTWIFDSIAINSSLAPYPLAVLTSNPPPIAYWRLDEAEQGNGDTARPCNDYMNGQDDALYNNVNLGQPGYSGADGTDPNETSTLFGTYASTQSYAGQTSTNIPFPSGANGTVVNFSVEAWVNSTAVVDSAVIVTKGEYGLNESFDLTVAANGTDIRFWPRASAGAVSTDTTGVELPRDGSFHHIVGVCDETGGHVWVYIDGTNANAGGIGTPIGAVGVNTNAFPVQIGSGTDSALYPSTYQQWKGAINDVAIYNYALTPSQVLTHYEARGVPPTVGTAPYNTNISQGDTLVVSPVVTGSKPLFYEWADANNSGAIVSTNATLIISNIQASDYYSLTVSNSLGTNTSFSVNANVIAGPPQIYTQPAPPSITLYGGETFTYSILAYGTLPLSYQWYVDANNTGTFSIPLATNTTFAATAVAGATNVYSCTVTGVGSSPSQTAALAGVALPTNLYSLTVLSNHPIAYWPLNEQPDANNTDGNDTVIANDYAGGHDAMYLNVDLGEAGFDSSAESDTAALFGVFGAPTNSYAGEIDNSSLGLSNIDFSVAAAAAGGNAEFTVECWVKTTNSQSATSTIIAKGYLGSGGDQFAITAYTNSFGFLVRDFGSQGLDGTTGAVTGPYSGVNNLNDGNWHYLVAVVDQGGKVNGNIQLYHDGVNVVGDQFQAGKSLNGDPMGATDPAANLVSIGAMAASKTAATLANQFVGTISEVALYNYAMTSAQIASNYNAFGLSQIVISGPVPQAVLAGATVPMTATVTGGKPPFTYQWQQNGTNIAGATAIPLLLTGVPATAGSYDLIVSNAPYASPVTSSVVQVTIAPELTFYTNGAGWSAQGNTFSWLGNSALQLTADIGSESNSSFYSSPVYVGAFQASFTYQVVNPSGTLADGATFCLQNDPRGATAIGTDGGALGYGSTTSGITNSVAFEINIYSNNIVGVAFGTNGTIGPNGTTTNGTPPLVLNNGDVISNLVTYDGTTLAVTMTDVTVGSANDGATFATNVVLNIPNVLGTNVAYVGFTAGDGGSKATQVISNFAYIPIIDMAIQPSAGATVITWPAGVGGYILQQSSSLAPAHWTAVANAVNVVNNLNQVTVPISATTQFYRLALPVPPL